MYIKRQKFLVLGISKSGFSVADYILDNGGECYLYEEKKNDKILDAINKLVAKGGKFIEKEQGLKTVEDIDVVVISPGVPINHPIAIKSKELGKRLIGELEFSYTAFLPLFIGVTGTNGKTTVVSLIDAILREYGLKSRLVGNCGIPLSSEIENVVKDDVCVTEVSSYQLESVNAFCPHIACVTNIAPDHLERHYTMENYVYLKKRIYKNQKESEFTVLNFDDLTVREFAKDTRGKIIYVSLFEKVDGAYRDNGKIYYKGKYVLDESELSLVGEHNVSNALFAVACAEIMGVPSDVTAKALKEFKGVKHRVELIAEKDAVKYYNDSKATNTTSTISAISSISEPIVLILGGSEKGESYCQLFGKIKNSSVKHVIICGASRFSMEKDALKVGFENYSIIKDFALSIKFASIVAKSGDSVLLSPACASFDNFSSFEERGDEFCKIVQSL